MSKVALHCEVHELVAQLPRSRCQARKHTQMVAMAISQRWRAPMVSHNGESKELAGKNAYSRTMGSWTSSSSSSIKNS